MTANLSRKQREILDREELILSTARHILRVEGYAALSMDKIAKSIEYARGTIYQHYPNKEEILAAICTQNMTLMAGMFDKALAYEGNSREKMVAVMLAYEIFIRLHPHEFQDFQIIKNVTIRNKLSENSLSKLSALEHHVVNCIAHVVREALANNELVLTDTTPEELVFGLWSMAFGAITLQFTDIPLDQLGIKNPMRIARIHSRKLLDGYGWKPNSAELNYDQTAENIFNTVFKEEAQKLNSQQENMQ